MSNGMPSWKEWNEEMKPEQREYELHKILSQLQKHLSTQCPARIEVCDVRFKVLEKRKWLDRGAAIAGGFVSGLLGALGIKLGG